MASVRVSPGIYRDTNSGALARSAKRPKAPRGTPIKKSVPTKTRLKSAGDIINTNLDIGQRGSDIQNRVNNPNINDPLYIQHTDIDPVTGQPTITRTSSQGEQTALNNKQGAGQQAYNALGDTLGTFSNFGQGDATDQYGNPVQASNNRFEQSVFNQLTSGLKDQQGQEQEQLSQKLADQGIPVGSQAYNDQMNQFQKRYDNLYNNARATAVQQSTQNSISASNVLGGLNNAAYQDPNAQGFNQAQWDPNQGTNVFGAITQRDAANAAIQAANRRNQPSRGGGGGGGASDNAFFSGPPPGA